MNIRNLIIIAFAFLSCEKQETDDTVSEINFEQLMTTESYKTLPDTDADLLSLDVYYRNDIDLKKPVVVYVHGGGWLAGDKTNSLDNKINLFERLNYTFVSVNYRLSPMLSNQSMPDRIQYPAHNIDVAAAIAWVIENIDRYGGNPENIVLLGHSAGAHLVSLTGTNQNFMEQAGYSFSNIKGVASIDTEGYDVRSKVLGGSQIYINAFGTNEEQNIEASPVFNVSATTTYPKFFIAKRGAASRITIADTFIQRLLDSEVETYEIDGSIYDHNGINNAIGNMGETLITDSLIAFFERCFE